MPYRDETRYDLILFYHHDLTNAKAPMLSLQKELTRRGMRCLVLSREGPQRTETSLYDTDDDTALERWFRDSALYSTSRLRAWALVLRSFGAVVLVTVLLLARGRTRLLDIARNPLRLWLKYLRSAQRIDAYDEMLRSLQAKALVVTHERFTPGSEMLLAPAAGSIRTYHYHHGFSTIYEIPYLSKHVLVWNESDRNMLLALPGLKTAPRMTVVGNAELDAVFSNGEDGKPYVLGESSGTRPVIVFLSQLVPEISHNVEGMRVSLTWIAAAARRYPSYYFVVKEHHSGDGIGSMMESLGMRTIPNVAILEYQAAALSDLLRDDRVAAIVSFSSTGLYLAAGSGKTAIRFIVEGMDEPIALIDEVSILIHSEREFLQALETLVGEGAGNRRAVPEGEAEAHFPNKGTAVRAIADVIEAELLTANGREGAT